MIDVGAFLVNRIEDLIIGLILGLILSIIVSIFIFFSVETDTRKQLIPKLLIIITVIFGLMTFFQLSLGELSVLSYIDMFQGSTGLIFLILVVLFVLVIGWYASYVSDGELFQSMNISGRLRSKKVQNYGGPITFIFFMGIFVVFFIFIFTEDFGFLFVLLVPIGSIILLVVIIRVLINSYYRSVIFVVIKKGKPALFIAFFILGSLIAIIGYFSFIHATYFAPVNQANYFNSFIETSTDDLFVNEIQNDQLRLVDKELAQAIVDRQSSVFGSNVQAKSLHITTYNGRLVWIAAMGADNIFQQELEGILIVDANDPTLTPTKIEFGPGEAVISENLFYGAETKRVSWLQDPYSSYGRTYLTWNPENELVQIQTFNSPQLFEWVTYYGGVRVYDLKGELLQTYTDPDTMPSWISQPFDEDWLESNIYNWGHLRQGDGFNIFASGFLGLVTPSADRLEISRDTRYIVSPDTNETVAITPVHPSTNTLSNAGVFLSKHDSIIYYDYHQRDYVSSESIEQYVESQEPPASQGEYYATLPMFYKVGVSAGETRMVYAVPVYYQTSTYNSDGDYYTYNVQFRGLYILDAKKQEVFGRAYLADNGGNTGAMITSAKNAYLSSLANAGLGGDGPVNQTEDDSITVNITQIEQYVANGTTHIALKTNNSQYAIIIASPEKLALADWLYTLFEVEVGTIVKFKAIRENSVWFLTEIQSV
jgi:hypothetical protein